MRDHDSSTKGERREQKRQRKQNGQRTGSRSVFIIQEQLIKRGKRRKK